MSVAADQISPLNNAIYAAGGKVNSQAGSRRTGAGCVDGSTEV
jgi:hypothetical protein